MSKNKRHMGRIAALSCAACGNEPVEVHHIRTERIKDDFLTIPLCVECHRGDFSIHMSKEQFTNVYGSELHLLAETLKRLED